MEVKIKAYKISFENFKKETSEKEAMEVFKTYGEITKFSYKDGGGSIVFSFSFQRLIFSMNFPLPFKRSLDFMDFYWKGIFKDFDFFLPRRVINPLRFSLISNRLSKPANLMGNHLLLL
jgi:hypothetical protein